MDFSNIFQLSAVTQDPMKGSYSWYLVMLSYLIAVMASYVALDITERIRTSGNNVTTKLWWLIGGAFAMGMGIWTMHFIGMLAYVMPMPMSYDPVLTGLSLLIAVVASAFAFYLIKNDQVKLTRLLSGGVLLGLGIVLMHYMGMSAMENVRIKYKPGLFILSIGIAIFASEAALWLMIKSSEINNKFHTWMKWGSALIMGLAVCGMHYTGMAAAVFFSIQNPVQESIRETALNPDSLSIYIALTTIIIMAIALIASRFWMKVLQSKNQKLIETEAILERKSLELQIANQNLTNLAKNSIAKEEKIRAILAAAADGILVVDQQGNIEICNRAAAEMLEYPMEYLISKNVIPFVIQKDRGEKSSMSMVSLIEKQETLTEYILCSKNNKQIPIELSISKALIADKNLYIIVFRDISERKTAQEKLAQLNHQLLTTARMAGMAEVATCVLHNVGNVLNSINVSAQILLQRDTHPKIEGLVKLSDRIEKNKDNLEQFLKEDPVGKILPEYLKQFAEYYKNEQKVTLNEIESLNSKIQHIKSIVVMQQTLSGGKSSILEKVNINLLLDEALGFNADLIEKHNVIEEREYASIPVFEIDRVKVMQVLVNIIRNALEALVESHKKEKKLTLKTYLKDPDHVQIEIIDNGIGIDSEDMSKIFSYGFTTKEKGHGFGLHSSALSIHELGGSLKATSDGRNIGSMFVLTLPLNSVDQKKIFQPKGIYE